MNDIDISVMWDDSLGGLFIQKPEKRPRDSFRQRLYDSEIQSGRRFTTVPEMQDYTDGLVGSKWFQRHYPGIDHIEIRSGAGYRSACAYLRHIQMPKWARIESILIHEIAHIATDSVYGRDGIAAHGREFARTYLHLLQHQMGKEFADRQKAAFRAAKVKYSLPKQLSLQRRIELQARGRALAAAKRRPEGK